LPSKSIQQNGGFGIQAAEGDGGRRFGDDVKYMMWGSDKILFGFSKIFLHFFLMFLLHSGDPYASPFTQVHKQHPFITPGSELILKYKEYYFSFPPSSQMR
jgi:hypothetical protein